MFQRFSARGLGGAGKFGSASPSYCRDLLGVSLQGLTVVNNQQNPKPIDVEASIITCTILVVPLLQLQYKIPQNPIQMIQAPKP